MPQIRHLLIALPTVARAMKSSTAIAVARTAVALERSGVSVSFHNIDSAEIVTARDMFANMLLYSDTWDALLFVDSDMGFEPDLVMRMIQQDAEVVAAACPRRTLNLPKFIDSAVRLKDLKRARSQASQFTVFHDWNRREDAKIHVENGFCDAAAAGMAIALITKKALRDMVAAGVVSPRLDLNSNNGKQCYSFFGILEPEGGRLGEDYSFCFRWTKQLARPMRVCVDEVVSHYGDFEYYGRYADLFE